MNPFMISNLNANSFTADGLTRDGIGSLRGRTRAVNNRFLRL
jgi:hypothetical protein